MQKPLDALISRDDRARENREHDRDPCQVLDAPIAEREALARRLARKPERNRERDRGRGITEIVDRVRKQRDAAGEEDHHQLQNGRGGETNERPFDRPQPPVVGRDRGIDDAVGVSMAGRMIVRVVVRIAMTVHCST